jgi:membrane associated rhomboid family serine protease
MNGLKKLRNRFERFCFRHRNVGVPNLMLFVCLGAGLVYLMSYFAQNYELYYWLAFDRSLILQGQVWRLFTYPLTYGTNNLVLTAISLVCYWSLGTAVERQWGTLRFNLYYFTGMLLMDVFALAFGGWADATHLNLSLFLAYATMYPDAQFMIMFIIPVKAWVLALVDLVLVLLGLLTSVFPYNLFSVLSIANYFLFFGKDVLRVIPISWQANFRRLFRKKPKRKAGEPKPIPFPTAGSYQATVAKPKAPYTHRCVVCGRTDVSDPNLEFRYCSRCSGYHCYCEDHINHHEHITE